MKFNDGKYNETAYNSPAVVTFTLTIYIEGEGTVEVEGIEVYSGWSEDYEKMEKVLVEAFEDIGWEFKHWEIG